MSKKSVVSLVAAAVLSLSISATANDLPDLGASALTVLSIEKEKRLGDVLFNEMRGHAGVLKDPLTQEYLNTLGNRLVAHANDVKFPFTFFAIHSNDINAFAFYGGHIGIHTGLIAEADTESQLASVIGHEIAHVTQRHLARRQQAAAQQTPLTLAGIVGSILLTAINPQAALAGVMATSAGASQSSINFTRQNEQEADNVGMNILADAGYDPYAAGEFFAKLQAEFRYKTKPPQFLVTHPLPESRVTDARLRAHQFERRFYSDSLDFLLLKHRILARYTYDPDIVVEYYEDLVTKLKGNKLFAAQYGLALAYVDNEFFDKAEKLLDQLSQQAPNNLFILDTFSDLYTAKKDFKTALDKLGHAYQLRPNNSVVTLNFANVAIASGNYEKAIKLLEYFLLTKPDDLIAHELLRQAYNKTKNMAKYHATGAEYFALVSNYTKAIQSADLALSTLNPENTSEISRLEALKIQFRQRMKYMQKIKGKM